MIGMDGAEGERMTCWTYDFGNELSTRQERGYYLQDSES